MYCSNCGKEIDPKALVCTNCGVMVASALPSQADGNIRALRTLCFLSPGVGLVLYLLWKDSIPVKAKVAGMAALWGFIFSVVVGILFLVVRVLIRVS